MGQPAWELTWIALIDLSGSSVTPLVRDFSPPGLQNNKRVVEVVPFAKGETFLKIAWLSASEWDVVMGGLGAIVPQGPYQRQAWDDEVLRAQAVAART
jgi:hypothetical protein